VMKGFFWNAEPNAEPRFARRAAVDAFEIAHEVTGVDFQLATDFLDAQPRSL
jgi:hypothetical protein